MCDTEGNRRICVLDNLFDCQQPHQHIHLKEKNHSIQSIHTNHSIVIIVCKFKNSFSEKKLPLKENVRINL